MPARILLAPVPCPLTECLPVPGPPPRTPTTEDLPPLLKAAKLGDAERVARLLEAGGHDPAETDVMGRTAYQLAATKEVRSGLGPRP